jgi:hypothetical protein
VQSLSFVTPLHVLQTAQYFIIFLAVLGFEHRALCVLGKSSIIELCLSPIIIFALNSQLTFFF